ncbi:hypothetical protein FQR65_LT11134 [Abscondita terminalis]|nr:hypothetical protein FQR65_LT11134 [Abscondita terminalis]
MLVQFGIFFILIFNVIRTVFNECEIDHVPETDMYKFGTYIFNGTIGECNCGDTKICVRKCCHLNYVWIDQMCVLNSSLKFQVDIYDGTTLINDGLDFRYLPGRMLCRNSTSYYRLEPISYPEDVFYVQRDGRLWQPSLEMYIDPYSFCLEYFEDIGFAAFACYDSAAKVERMLNTLGMMISMPFLLSTFIVYALLPEKNLHGKSLMSYVITLFGGYLFLIIVQEHTNVAGPRCTTLGTFCLFFFMVSFLWMNVMSIDIWWTFKGVRGFSGNKQQVEQKKFLMYSAYTWGSSSVFVIIVTIINEASPKGVWYKPGIGDGQCWFTLGMPTFIYFYGPLTIIIITNIVLFARTSWKIKLIQRDTAILRRGENRINSEESDEQRFYLYLKLFMAMGVNWSMEIISWLIDWQVEKVHPAIWYLTDFCNALYGVFIFFIFVFKRPVWNLLKKRYYLAIGKIQLARTIRVMDSPSTTTTTGISLSERSTMK